MFHLWCTEWGNLLPTPPPPLHTRSCFFLSHSWLTPSFPSRFRIGITSPNKPSLVFSSWMRCPSRFCLVRYVLYLLACRAHSRSLINLQHLTSLTVDGLNLFTGTNLCVVHQTDWFFVFFLWDFYMWIKVDGLGSKFGLSAVSLANHIFLISCIDGMIRHACYSATACYLGLLRMLMQLGMRNYVERELDAGSQKWYQLSQGGVSLTFSHDIIHLWDLNCTRFIP